MLVDHLQQFEDQWKQTFLVTWPSATVEWTPFNQLVISAIQLWVGGQVVGIFVPAAPWKRYQPWEIELSHKAEPALGIVDLRLHWSDLSSLDTPQLNKISSRLVKSLRSVHAYANSMKVQIQIDYKFFQLEKTLLVIFSVPFQGCRGYHDVPWHDVPFPTYPFLQVQSWEPLVLVQFAFTSQTWFPLLHSLISGRNTDLETEIILTKEEIQA